ncbi:MAG: ABC transporter substrate-binding protein [Caedimonadaceae bacterium]|nr:MAG: ABC transporter substrate-binding protein [Caedimonadaceae bacterium]
MQNSRFRFSFWAIFLCVAMGSLWIYWTRTPLVMDKKIHISILQVIEHPALDRTRQGIVDGLKEAGLEEGRSMILSYESAQGNPSLSGQIATKFVGERPNILVGISTPSAQSLVAAARHTSYPLIFASVTDPLGSKLVTSLENPTEQVTGVSNFIDLKPQVELMKEIVPALKAVGIIYNPGEANSVTLVKALKEILPTYGLTLVEATASKTADVGDAARRLIGRVGAIFITNDSTALSAFKSIAHVADDAGCPLFSSDVDQVGEGALAAYGPNQYELGRQTARMILKRLHQSNAVIPVEFPKTLELHIDKDAAKRINLTLSPSVLKKAQKIYDHGVS